MITMTLNTDAIHKALVQHLTHDLGMDMSGKDCEITVIVGRKSPTKPIPDITATINISDKPPVVLSLEAMPETEEIEASALAAQFQNIICEPPTLMGEILVGVGDEDEDEEDFVLPTETPETVFGDEEVEEEEEEVTTAMAMNTVSLFNG
jgi:hypothetical protein